MNKILTEDKLKKMEPKEILKLFIKETSCQEVLNVVRKEFNEK